MRWNRCGVSHTGSANLFRAVHHDLIHQFVEKGGIERLYPDVLVYRFQKPAYIGILPELGFELLFQRGCKPSDFGLLPLILTLENKAPPTFLKRMAARPYGGQTGPSTPRSRTKVGTGPATRSFSSGMPALSADAFPAYPCRFV